MLPLVGARLPARQIEQRGLAGPVRSDQPDDLAALHRERQAVDRRHAAEPLDHALGAQDRLRPPESLGDRQDLGP